VLSESCKKFTTYTVTDHEQLIWKRAIIRNKTSLTSSNISQFIFRWARQLYTSPRIQDSSGGFELSNGVEWTRTRWAREPKIRRFKFRVLYMIAAYSLNSRKECEHAQNLTLTKNKLYMIYVVQIDIVIFIFERNFKWYNF
jgi:hypothetical protein